MLSREGLCDFGRPGVRRPEHRAVLVDHLHLFCWHNGWTITKKRLFRYSYKQLIGMLNRLARGQASWMFDRLLEEQGYSAVRHGLPSADPPPPPAQLRLGFEGVPEKPVPKSNRRSA